MSFFIIYNLLNTHLCLLLLYNLRLRLYFIKIFLLLKNMTTIKTNSTPVSRKFRVLVVPSDKTGVG
jgi:hypothetical protein